MRTQIDQSACVHRAILLQIKYSEVYQPKNVIITSQKLKVRESYKKTIEDLVEKKEFKKLQTVKLIS